MSSTSQSVDSSTTKSSGKLKSGQLGLWSVVFMVVAFSAPITAMTGNTPVAIGYGNGIGAPAGFMVATIVLVIFSVAFTALAKHITSAGAFYTFVSRGLNRPLGLSAGWLSMTAYVVMEAGLVGIFSVFAQDLFKSSFNIDLPWIVYGLIAILIMGILSHRDVALAAKILTVVLILELTLLVSMTVSVLFNGGGADGLIPQSLNPFSAFSTNNLAAGSAAIGLLFAFWSWVGFESTAIYGEESKDPKRIIPAATLIAVIGIGVFYTFITWGIVAGNGIEGSEMRATSDDPFSVITYPMEQFLGPWSVNVLLWLAMLGSFACALAIHNSATRYIFAMARDHLLPRKLGESHHKYQSPHRASMTQSIISAAIVLVCFLSGVDPYGQLFVLVAMYATIAFLTAQALTCVATLNYFHIRKEHPETASWWRTVLAPIIGGLGMLYVLWLLLSNYAFAAGSASETLVGRLVPWLALVVLIAGVVCALIWRKTNPTRYQRIGSTVFDESTDDVKRDEISSLAAAE